ncbi:glycosyltransferase [Acaryochloris marina]|uniref:glycosyltransferase n=1 Tax=Acaryochloris marina TaxID=155978 RepID=UPI001BB08A57|nr:glycosyltransferase [Acaryochloris marina]QUY44742.1 glycosyltransferase family 2 protein [Acaryochloris marina S15]
MVLGVSIIICCYNSAQELPQTLQNLVLQQVSADVPWEVVIIDNASTDATAKVAQSLWPNSAPAPLRIVHESNLGLINARYRALSEAQYEILSFIDDDNWICSNWVQTVSELMSHNSEIGACGSHNIPAFDGEKPWWFDLSSRSYAVGKQGPDEGGDITGSRGRLIGAGLTIRKCAWQQLVDKGFNSLLVGCQGKALNRGEDTELTFALVLAGWRIWYEPRLTLQHHLQAERLQWSYLRRLRRNGGKATIGFDPYRFAFEEKGSEHHISFWWNVTKKSDQKFERQVWYFQVVSVLKELLWTPMKLFTSFFRPMEGSLDVLKIETKIGRLLELLNNRRAYDINIQSVRNAAWRNKNLEHKIVFMK